MSPGWGKGWGDVGHHQGKGGGRNSGKGGRKGKGGGNARSRRERSEERRKGRHSSPRRRHRSRSRSRAKRRLKSKSRSASRKKRERSKSGLSSVSPPTSPNNKEKKSGGAPRSRHSSTPPKVSSSSARKERKGPSSSTSTSPRRGTPNPRPSSRNPSPPKDQQPEVVASTSSVENLRPVGSSLSNTNVAKKKPPPPPKLNSLLTPTPLFGTPTLSSSPRRTKRSASPRRRSPQRRRRPSSPHRKLRSSTPPRPKVRTSSPSIWSPVRSSPPSPAPAPRRRQPSSSPDVRRRHSPSNRRGHSPAQSRSGKGGPPNRNFSGGCRGRGKGRGKGRRNPSRFSSKFSGGGGGRQVGGINNNGQRRTRSPDRFRKHPQPNNNKFRNNKGRGRSKGNKNNRGFKNPEERRERQKREEEEEKSDWETEDQPSGAADKNKQSQDENREQYEGGMFPPRNATCAPGPDPDAYSDVSSTGLHSPAPESKKKKKTPPPSETVTLLSSPESGGHTPPLPCLYDFHELESNLPRTPSPTELESVQNLKRSRNPPEIGILSEISLESFPGQDQEDECNDNDQQKQEERLEDDGGDNFFMTVPPSTPEEEDIVLLKPGLSQSQKEDMEEGEIPNVGGLPLVDSDDLTDEFQTRDEDRPMHILKTAEGQFNSSSARKSTPEKPTGGQRQRDIEYLGVEEGELSPVSIVSSEESPKDFREAEHEEDQDSQSDIMIIEEKPFKEDSRDHQDHLQLQAISSTVPTSPESNAAEDIDSEVEVEETDLDPCFPAQNLLLRLDDDYDPEEEEERISLGSVAAAMKSHDIGGGGDHHQCESSVGGGVIVPLSELTWLNSSAKLVKEDDDDGKVQEEEDERLDTDSAQPSQSVYLKEETVGSNLSLEEDPDVVVIDPEWQLNNKEGRDGDDEIRSQTSTPQNLAEDSDDDSEGRLIIDEDYGSPSSTPPLHVSSRHTPPQTPLPLSRSSSTMSLPENHLELETSEILPASPEQQHTSQVFTFPPHQQQSLEGQVEKPDTVGSGRSIQIQTLEETLKEKLEVRNAAEATPVKGKGPRRRGRKKKTSTPSEFKSGSKRPYEFMLASSSSNTTTTTCATSSSSSRSVSPPRTVKDLIQLHPSSPIPTTDSVYVIRGDTQIRPILARFVPPSTSLRREKQQPSQSQGSSSPIKAFAAPLGIDSSIQHIKDNNGELVTADNYEFVYSFAASLQDDPASRGHRHPSTSLLFTEMLLREKKKEEPTTTSQNDKDPQYIYVFCRRGQKIQTAEEASSTSSSSSNSSTTRLPSGKGFNMEVFKPVKLSFQDGKDKPYYESLEYTVLPKALLEQSHLPGTSSSMSFQEPPQVQLTIHDGVILATCGTPPTNYYPGNTCTIPGLTPEQKQALETVIKLRQFESEGNANADLRRSFHAQEPSLIQAINLARQYALSIHGEELEPQRQQISNKSKRRHSFQLEQLANAANFERDSMLRAGEHERQVKQALSQAGKPQQLQLQFHYHYKQVTANNNSNAADQQSPPVTSSGGVGGAGPPLVTATLGSSPPQTDLMARLQQEHLMLEEQRLKLEASITHHQQMEARRIHIQQQQQLAQMQIMEQAKANLQQRLQHQLQLRQQRQTFLPVPAPPLGTYYPQQQQGQAMNLLQGSPSPRPAILTRQNNNSMLQNSLSNMLQMPMSMSIPQSPQNLQQQRLQQLHQQVFLQQQFAAQGPCQRQPMSMMMTQMAPPSNSTLPSAEAMSGAGATINNAYRPSWPPSHQYSSPNISVIPGYPGVGIGGIPHQGQYPGQQQQFTYQYQRSPSLLSQVMPGNMNMMGGVVGGAASTPISNSHPSSWSNSGNGGVVLSSSSSQAQVGGPPPPQTRPLSGLDLLTSVTTLYCQPIEGPEGRSRAKPFKEKKLRKPRTAKDKKEPKQVTATGGQPERKRQRKEVPEQPFLMGMGILPPPPPPPIPVIDLEPETEPGSVDGRGNQPAPHNPAQTIAQILAQPPCVPPPVDLEEQNLLAGMDLSSSTPPPPPPPEPISSSSGMTQGPRKYLLGKYNLEEEEEDN